MPRLLCLLLVPLVLGGSAAGGDDPPARPGTIRGRLVWASGPIPPPQNLEVKARPGDLC